MKAHNNHENQEKTARRPFNVKRREPLIVTKSIARMLVTAGGPQVNTQELRTDFFEVESAGWTRTRGGSQLDACDALLGEPYGRWS